MKILNYIFWRFWRFRVKKENGDENGAYWFATILWGFFFVYPLIVFKINHLINIILDITNSRLIQLILIFPIAFLCSIPVRLIFPKKKIFALEYSITDKKQLNFKILYIFIFFLSLILFGILYLYNYKKI